MFEKTLYIYIYLFIYWFLKTQKERLTRKPEASVIELW
jgi:hypothetical protein